MSREFGSYHAGYFHTQIETAASDCLEGRDRTTILWGEFLKEFEGVAWAISSSEACDSGEYHSITESIKAIPNLEMKLENLKKHLRPFEDVARNAVREAIAQKEGSDEQEN